MDSQTRQEYIRAAVSFLRNPKLVDSPLKDKLKFLKDKGLSDVEVDEALNLALIERHQSQGSRWNFLLILGLCVGGYKLYQAYLESKSRHDEQQKSETKSKIVHSNKEESSLQIEKVQPTLNEILQKVSELKTMLEYQRKNFGSDIQSLKTLLLGHEKFVAPPKIPEWQLKKSENDSERSSNMKEVDGDKKGKKKNKNTELLVKGSSDQVIEPSLISPNHG